MQSIDLDCQLVLAMAAGDREALGRLYDRHCSLMLAVAIRMLGERAEAEDLVHDVLLEAWRRADTYAPERASVKSWLMLRLRSRALDRLRSARVSRRAPASEAQLEKEPAIEREDPALAPDRSRVGARLDALPGAQKAVVELVYFEGLSAREAAARLEVPVGTVKSRLAAALSKLRDALNAKR